MSNTDTAYLVFGSFGGKPAIWRVGVFDSEEEAVAEWDECAARHEHEHSLELIEVLKVSMTGGGHIVVDRLDPRR